MLKEKIDYDVEAESSLEAIRIINQNNLFSPPVIRSAIVISACIVGMSSVNANGKVLIGINNEIVEYKSNRSDAVYPSYKVPPKKSIKAETVQNISIEEKNYTLSIYAPDVVSQKIINDLGKEISMLKNRLDNSLPVHTLVYMVCSSSVGAIAATLLFVRFILNVYIIDPYYLICTLIICFGLFFTAFASLKDWKDNLLNEKTS